MPSICSQNELQELLSLAHRGDAAAKGRLFLGLHRVAERTIRRRIGAGVPGRIESEDLASDVIVKMITMFAQLRRCDSIDSVLSFLAHLIRFELKDRFRHEAALKRDFRRNKAIDADVSSQTCDPSLFVEASETRDMIRKDRSLRELSILDLAERGFLLREIAERVGLHARTVQRTIDDIYAALNTTASQREGVVPTHGRRSRRCPSPGGKRE